MLIQEEDAVARRALALVALLTRTQLEHGVQADKSRTAGWQRFHRELADWMEKEGVRAALSSAERQLLDRPLGEWTNDNIFECIWRSESLTALLWALSMLDWMPTHGKRVDEAVINPHIQALKPVAPWLESVHLRGGRPVAGRSPDRGVLALAGAVGPESPAGQETLARRYPRSGRCARA